MKVRSNIKALPIQGVAKFRQNLLKVSVGYSFFRNNELFLRYQGFTQEWKGFYVVMVSMLMGSILQRCTVKKRKYQRYYLIEKYL